MDLTPSTRKSSITTLPIINTRTTNSRTVTALVVRLVSPETLHLTAARLLLLTMARTHPHLEMGLTLLPAMDLTLLPAMDQDFLALLEEVLEDPLLHSSARMTMKSSPALPCTMKSTMTACTPSSIPSSTVDPRLMALRLSFAGSLSVLAFLLLRLTHATIVMATTTTKNIRKSTLDLEADALIAALITRRRMDPRASVSARTSCLIMGHITTFHHRRRWR